MKDGRFQRKIAKAFAFDQVIEAYNFPESNQQIGKTVITVKS